MSFSNTLLWNIMTCDVTLDTDSMIYISQTMNTPPI